MPLSSERLDFISLLVRSSSANCVSSSIIFGVNSMPSTIVGAAVLVFVLLIGFFPFGLI